MVCQSVTKSKAWRGAAEDFHYEAEFSAVTSGSDENESFFAATPSGSIKLSTLKADHFTPGVDYYVDFVAASDD